MQRPDSGKNEGSAPAPVIYRQCPWCGFNNKSQGAGRPQCDKCERFFPDPMESRAAFESMFNRTLRRRIRNVAEAFFAGRRVRLVMLGVALGTALGEIGRRLWTTS